MNISIYEMTNTPSKRLALNNLTDSEKFGLILRLTESNNFLEVLEFIEQAHEDASWCNSYR